MKTIQIVATANKGEKTERALTISRQMPTTVEEATKVYGGLDRLLALAEDSFVIAAQQRMRTMLAKTGDERMADKDIVDDMAKWTPKARKAADPEKAKAKVASLFKGMDAKARAALLKELAKA